MSKFKPRAGRAPKGYPSPCREEAPSLTPRRFYCRLQSWHEGEHVSAAGAWNSGERTLRDRATPPKRRS